MWPKAGFADEVRQFTWRHRLELDSDRRVFQEAEDAVIRREFFVGLSALAVVPLPLMPGPTLGCGKSGALYLFASCLMQSFAETTLCTILGGDERAIHLECSLVRTH